MRLVITAGPPDIRVGLEPETGEEAMALEACAARGVWTNGRGARRHRAASGVGDAARLPLSLQLRRLRLHGLIARVPGTHRYRVTEPGLRLALFFTRVHTRLFRPGLSVLMPDVALDDVPLPRTFAHLEHAMAQWCAEAKLAA
jgi:hypothetical protein